MEKSNSDYVPDLVPVIVPQVPTNPKVLLYDKDNNPIIRKIGFGKQ